MGSILFRVVLLAGGLAIGEISLTSLASGAPIWIPQLVFSIALLVAGSAGFMGALLGRPSARGEFDG